ncbi:MAG TPA: glycosyltransferase [Streptosporangiaceae bacterium]
MTIPPYRMPPGGCQPARIVALVPAHNEAAAIGATIASLRRQTHPPDRIIVVADNCTDDTEDLSLLHGAEVLTTVGNTARKAGALNQALRQVLPGLGRADFVLAMDADSQLNADWIRHATGALRRDRWLGGVCGTYSGEPGQGVLLQLQRNEFVRAARMVGRRADLWVLSGTGTMFRVPVLREVARERGRTLPGLPGEYYCSASITEDYEITLALKTLGYRCLCPPGCTALTELMPTWRHLFRQRLRWQSGTLTALRRYGFTRATRANWVRQAFFYGRYCSQLACWAIIAWSLATHPGLVMPPWVLAMSLAIYVERIITVRRAGPWGVLLAVLLFPEWWYGMFDGLYLFHALSREFTQRDLSWGHVVKESAEHAPQPYRHPSQGGRPVPVPPAGNSRLRRVGDRPGDPGQAQAGTWVPPAGIRDGLGVRDFAPSSPSR